jgi:putative tryptophan/tyrosine transport system substrate-binding protein
MTQVVVALLCLGLLAGPLAVEAQRPQELRRIGYLHPGIGRLPGFYEVLREGLRGLGWVEGRNIVIEYRSGDEPRLAELATDLVRHNVEVIVTPGVATAAAKTATETVPIVFSFSGDPVEAGFVKSLGRPSGNMTGITWLAFELVGKRLELLKEAVPRVSRVAVLANPAHPGEQRELGRRSRPHEVSVPRSSTIRSGGRGTSPRHSTPSSGTAPTRSWSSRIS